MKNGSHSTKAVDHALGTLGGANSTCTHMQIMYYLHLPYIRLRCLHTQLFLILMVTLSNHMILRTAPPTSNSILSLIQDWWRVQDSLNGSWSL